MTEQLGATPQDSSTGFRVWAPNATRVAVQVSNVSGVVTGETGLAPAGGGYWEDVIAGLAAGTRYRYALTGPAGPQTRIDPYARQVSSSVGQALVYDENAFGWTSNDYQSPSWNELIIYELHVGTFDPDGTGIGTLSDAATKLGYLRELGITAIELLPLAEFAGDRSWGYNPALPFAVEEAYGGPDELKDFVDTAHRHGIAVILDVVYNHFGPSDLDNSLWRFDGWYLTDNGGGIYFYQDWRAESGWGPRPDYGRTEVRQYIRDNVLGWLEQYRLDGLRFDATASIRSTDGSGSDFSAIPDGWQLLRDCNDDVDASQPWKIRIAEDMRSNDAITTPTVAGGAGFPTQWDPDFVIAVRGALTATDDAQRSMAAVAAAIGRRYADRWLARVVYTESHDADANGGERLPSAIDQATPGSWYAKKRSTLGAAVVLTTPGIPMLFQGQEFLENLWFDGSRPIDWSKQTTYAGLRSLYQDLIALRRGLAGTTRGLRGGGLNVHHVNDSDKVLGYHRWDRGGPGDDTIVLLNFANRSYRDYRIGVPRPGDWHVRLNSDWAGYDPSFAGTAAYTLTADPEARDGMPASGAVGIGPYTVLVLSQNG